MKIIIDTNIVFSAILNSSGTIGKIIIASEKHFQFYSCDYLKTELLNHRNKLLKLTKLQPEYLDELETLVTKNITFINEELIPERLLIDTEIILADIDINDTPFVALAKYLDATLWTGDKELIGGLNSINFIKTITTHQLSAVKDNLENGNPA